MSKNISKKLKKVKTVDEHQSCSPSNYVQDALSIKLWGPLFDDFVDINILMILGSWGPGQVDDDDAHAWRPWARVLHVPRKKTRREALGSSLRR